MSGCGYQKLDVWRRSHQLAVRVYRITGRFPRAEQFRLVHQLCKAATSVPTNIAEGEGRFSRGDQIHFLHIARGSLFEAQYLILLAADLGYLKSADSVEVQREYDEIAKTLNGLIRLKRAS